VVRTIAIMCGLAASASAQVVNIDARTHCTAAGGVATLALDAGSYVLIPIGPPEGQFLAWNAWGSSVTGCDPTGAQCATGWIHGYRVSTDRDLAYPWKGPFATPEQALAAAVPVRIRLCEPATVRFFVVDDPCHDNAGGISLRVESDPCPADMDMSGSLDFFDFLTFQDLFAAGDMRADMDCSGDLDFFDFLAFQNLFAAGC
jgi:hypothetical protein